MGSYVKYYISAGILFLLTQMPVCSYASGTETPKNNGHIDDAAPEMHSVTDSIPSPHPIQQRLQDPDFDVRFNRGKLQPWHDIKTVYPRRTIPMSLLAGTPNKEKPNLKHFAKYLNYNTPHLLCC